jgi:surface antigen
MSSQYEGSVQVSQNLHNQEPLALLNSEGIDEVNRVNYLARTALRVGLAVSIGVSTSIGGIMLDQSPREAYASDTYPDKDKTCAHVGDPQFGEASGSGYWCDDYDWGDIIRNNQGAVTGASLYSSRGYGYRNCTDWAAFRVKELTTVAVPKTLSHAKYWDDNALSGWSKDLTPEVGDIAQSEGPVNDNYGHVGVVESVIKNAQDSVTSIEVSEYNKNRDGTYTLTSYAPTSGVWWRYSNHASKWDTFIDVNGTGNSGSSGPTPPPNIPTPLSYGNSGDIPLSGDWASAGITNVGTWRNGMFYLRNLDGTYTSVGFGNGTDTPIAGNWDGPGATQVGTWRNGTFYIRHGNGAYDTIPYGNGTDTPITGDWDANGYTNLGVWRAGTFYLRNNDGSTTEIPFGNSTDTPITGNWDGVGATQVGVWRNGVFYLRHSGGAVTSVPFGNATDVPVTGDWNANAITDVGVWRDGVFYLNE